MFDVPPERFSMFVCLCFSSLQLVFSSHFLLIAFSVFTDFLWKVSLKQELISNIWLRRGGFFRLISRKDDVREIIMRKTVNGSDFHNLFNVDAQLEKYSSERKREIWLLHTDIRIVCWLIYYMFQISNSVRIFNIETKKTKIYYYQDLTLCASHRKVFG